MAGQFRQRRFGGGRGSLGEDVNPSAYIVNLADCMLVLACGVIVALVAYFEVDLTGVRELKSEEMTPIDPETMPEDIGEGGTYYVEAGVVYMDPGTGQLYMVEDATAVEEATGDAGASGAGAEASDEDEEDDEEDIISARANGAD